MTSSVFIDDDTENAIQLCWRKKIQQQNNSKFQMQESFIFVILTINVLFGTLIAIWII